MTSRDRLNVGELAAQVRRTTVPLVRLLRRQAGGRFSPTELSVFGAVLAHGPLSQGDLAGREQLSAPTVSKVIASLEAAGVVERRACPTDRRVCLVAATLAGREWIEQGQQVRNAWLAERLQELTAEELEAMEVAMRALERIMDLES